MFSPCCQRPRAQGVQLGVSSNAFPHVSQSITFGASFSRSSQINHSLSLRKPLQRPRGSIQAGCLFKSNSAIKCDARFSALKCTPNGLKRSVLTKATPEEPGKPCCAAELQKQLVDEKESVSSIDEPVKASPPPPRKGADFVAALISVIPALVLPRVLPSKTGLSTQACNLVGIFATAILGLVTQPLPTGAWMLCCLAAALITKTLTFQAAMSAMCNETIWLIVISFFFAKGFEKTGLGERIADMFVAVLGSTTLGLAYGLTVAEAVLAPAMPSTTARAGGIFAPVVGFLSKSVGSEPHHNRHRLGAFLTHCCLQTSALSSTLFLTGAAQNLLCVSIAQELGVVFHDTFVLWLKGSIVPSVLGLIMIPVMLYFAVPPELKKTPEAPALARAKLREKGPPSRDELIMIVTLGGAVCLWVLGEQLGIAPVVAALLALCTLLATGVLTWQDCLQHQSAWDTLVWFSIVVSMSAAVTQSGLTNYVASLVGGALKAWNFSWTVSFGILHAAYFFVHYCFASQVGHVSALYGTFLVMMTMTGVPPVLAALTLAYSSNLLGSLTHYASGQAAVYYGTGYLSLKEVFALGLVMGLRSLLTFGTVGMIWWKYLGWY